jgi:Mce-associated membrane protein
VIGNDVEAPDAPDAPVTSPVATSRALVTSLASLCAVFFVAVIVLSIVAVNQRDARQSADADRHRVEDVASLLTTRLLSYDSARIDDTKAPVLALAAGKFRDDYERSFPGLKELLVGTKATQTGKVQEIYVSSIDGNSAHAIVIASIDHTGVGGRTSRPDAYLKLSLVKVGGAWKVDDVADLNFSQAAAGGSPSTAPTTTTVPGK